MLLAGLYVACAGLFTSLEAQTPMSMAHMQFYVTNGGCIIGNMKRRTFTPTLALFRAVAREIR
jgi:hypothetical protein